MTLSLQQLNTASIDEATALLDGIYEHSLWIAREAMSKRPFATLAALKYAMTQVVSQTSRDQQLGLIRAHPELAGKAMVSQSLTAESTNEQSKAGLTNCSPEEFAKLQKLNSDYNAKFGWPFILAVRGPRGLGLSRQQIISTFERRLHGHPDFELAECLRNIHRIAEIRLNDKFGAQPDLGSEMWDWHEALAVHSDLGAAENGQLTVTYMTEAHKACAAEIAARMRECGFDSVDIDVLGNVVGRYESNSASRNIYAGELPKTSQKSLLTGSHYDTVRNAGKYDGRLGIFTPMMCVRELHKVGKRLPFGIEVVAFSEEEGQRYKATFLASGALTGHFKPEWLDQADSEGILMKNTLLAGKESAQSAMEKIAFLKRDPAKYLGFVEVHIEQGPVLNAMNLPLGVVTSINGSVRLLGEIIGQASHAGTTPMATRRDAAAALAELSVYMEQRALKDGDSVATIGMLNVPNGSINVVPGKCSFSLDLRAPTDAQRDALVADVLAKLKEICAKRGVSYSTEETMRAAAAPSDAAWQARWEKAVASTGLPIYTMPSGAGHDAMKMHEIMPQAMLFVRGENSGISHNPLESTTQDDMQLGIDAFMQLLNNLAQEQQ
jgi:beta-ureidopropionase / N-carbamoyl-L-amino-acid hydrolase